MRTRLLLLFAIVFPWLLTSCKGEENEHLSTDEENVSSSIAPATNLRAEATKNECEIKVIWTNPKDKYVQKVELSYQFKEAINDRSQSTSPILVDVVRDTEDTYLLKVPEYAVYPANGNERFYDDNIWIGLDMADLHAQIQDQRFLDKATMVWNYLMTGNDAICGGGIYWRDNIRSSDMVVSKDKFSYNSGQPMLTACLLYEITKEAKYLTDAQLIAHSAYEKTLTHAWLSNCRNNATNLLNSNDFRGINSQSSWEILHEGACIEMLVRLASLERDGL